MKNSAVCCRILLNSVSFYHHIFFRGRGTAERGRKIFQKCFCFYFFKEFTQHLKDVSTEEGIGVK
jgi:hypothetical protein